MTNECPFCSKKVTGKSFASSNGNLALYNLSPILEGHSLIIPEKHCASLFDMSENEISDFFSFARMVTSFLCSVYEADAYDWSLQEGREAGQSVDHLHLHIIPRKPGDLKENENWYNLFNQQQSGSPDNDGRSNLSDTEFNKISDYLKARWEKQQSEI